MALKPCCDVFGTAAGVKKYRVEVHEIVGQAGEEVESKLGRIELDLCPRGLDRLQHFIARGTAPPKTKVEEGNHDNK